MIAWLGVAPLRLLALYALAASAIVALYLVRQRRRTVRVPFAALWQRAVGADAPARRRDRLRTLLSLLLQLVLLGAVVLALGDPRPAAAARRGRSVVVLLDGSASMQATDVPGGRAAAARAAARSLVRTFGPADRAMVVQVDAEVTPLRPFTADAETLAAAIASYAPRDTGADLPRALAFARDALAGAPSPEIVLVGDGAYGSAPVDVALPGIALRFVPVGRRGRNVGVTAFAARRHPLDRTRCEAMVTVQSWSDRPERVVLAVRADGADVARYDLALAPGESVQRVLPGIASGERLEAAVSLADGTADDLAADDVAYAALPTRRRLSVLSVTEGNRYLEAALLLDGALDVVEATPSDAPAMLRARSFDAVITDVADVAVPPGTNWIALRPPAGVSPCPAELGFVDAPAGAAIGFEHVDRRHPVTRFATDLEAAHIGRIVRYRPRHGDRVLGASSAGPLLVAGERGRGRFVLFAFDVRESDVPLQIAWPVVLVSAMDWFAGDDGGFQSGGRTGVAWRLAVPAGTTQAIVVTPSGRRVRVPVTDGRAVFVPVERGFHVLDAGGARTLAAASLADASESACAPSRTFFAGGTRATAPPSGSRRPRGEAWVALLCLALAIVILEWAAWHRRFTV